MLDWYLFEMRERYNERQREVDSILFAREFSLAQCKVRLSDKVLATFGHRLVEWGRQLEERHPISRTVGVARQPDVNISPMPELLGAQKTGELVALDGSGAAHKHMNLYAHSHRG